MTTKSLFDTRFNIGATDAEPTIRDMIIRYYTSHGIAFDIARHYAVLVVAAGLSHVREQLK